MDAPPPGRWPNDLVYRPPPPVSAQLPFQQQAAEWRRAYYALHAQLATLARIHHEEHRVVDEEERPPDKLMTDPEAVAYAARIVAAAKSDRM